MNKIKSPQKFPNLTSKGFSNIYYLLACFNFCSITSFCFNQLSSWENKKKNETPPPIVNNIGKNAIMEFGCVFPVDENPQ